MSVPAAESGPEIIATVGIRALPGTYKHQGEPISSIIRHAVGEAVLLSDAGFDGLIIQNINDFPGMEKVNPEIISYMTVIGSEIKRAVPNHLKTGVSVLWNDGEAALSVADALEADFVRLKVFIGAMVNAEGLVEGCSAEVLQLKKRLESRVELWADVLDRTGVPLCNVSLEEAVTQACGRGLADSLIITGRNAEETLGMVSECRRPAGDCRLYAGGGCTAENLSDFIKNTDGVIVASALKKSGSMYNGIDEERLRIFSDAMKKAKTYIPEICANNKLKENEG